MDRAAVPVVESAQAVGSVRRRWLAWLLVLALLLALVGEVVGRVNGLHQPVVYQQTAYGYRPNPDQDLRRFGNRVRYNAFGLRNEAIEVMPAAGVTRVLCVGDSVANGGAITDQDKTIGYRLQEVLRPRLGSVEVLNASAPGWAIANELGWLRTFGTFGSRYVVLIISTHDLFQALAPADTVDNHPAFPSARPLLALQNVVVQYLVPRFFPDHYTDPGAVGVEASERQAKLNRQDILAIAHLVAEREGRLLVVFLEQAGDNGRDAMTLGTKRQFFALMAQERIPVATLTSEVETIGRQAMFRDDVHPNLTGNQTIAEAIARELERFESGHAESRPTR
jgi:lysophospholipase L1-like esterase